MNKHFKETPALDNHKATYNTPFVWYQDSDVAWKYIRFKEYDTSTVEGVLDLLQYGKKLKENDFYTELYLFGSMLYDTAEYLLGRRLLEEREKTVKETAKKALRKRNS